MTDSSSIMPFPMVKFSTEKPQKRIKKFSEYIIDYDALKEYKKKEKHEKV